MRYIVLFDGETTLVDDDSELESYLREEANERDTNGCYYNGFDNFVSGVEVFALETPVSVTIERSETRVTIGEGDDIPSPIPGESKADYVKRLIG